MDPSQGPVIVLGTYERFLFGFSVSAGQGNLNKVFAQPAHKGVVHTVAAASPFLVSGGGDEQLHAYDCKLSADLGTLLSPGGGGVYAAALFSMHSSRQATHMLSGAAEGNLVLWQAGDEWRVLKNMAGHSKAVTGLAVHPSGRAALSVGRDALLRLWNLAKGKSQYKTRLRGVADGVAFLPGGDQYALQEQSEVSVHSTGEEGLLAALQHPCRVGALAFLSANEAVTGAEDGMLRVFDLRSPSAPVLAFQAHGHRLRGVIQASPDAGATASAWAAPLASSSSDGVVRLWDLRTASSGADAAPSASPLHEVETHARVTCMTCIRRPDPGSGSGTGLAAEVLESKPQTATEPLVHDDTLQSSRAAHAAKAFTKGNSSSTPARQKRESSHVKKQQAADVQDGVVSFPDDLPDAHKKKRKKAKKAAQAPSAAPLPGLTASHHQGPCASLKI